MAHEKQGKSHTATKSSTDAHPMKKHAHGEVTSIKQAKGKQATETQVDHQTSSRIW